MQILRSFGIVLVSFVFLANFAFANDDKKTKSPNKNGKAVSEKRQQLVESVDIQGNRRLKDQDLLYYIKTRPGDTYNAKQLERDLKELLSFNWFDKVESSVLTSPGIRGGVDVIFQVKELPIIRDLQFKGTKAIQESDILKAFRERRVGISKEAVYDPVKARNAKRILREMLASKGYPNAKITVTDEEVSRTSVAVVFDIKQGRRSRIVKIEFEGNKAFKDSELKKSLELVKESSLISRFKGQDILHLEKLQFDLQKNVREYMFSKGYFQARIGEPRVEGLGYKRTGFPVLKNIIPIPLISSKDDTLKIIVPIIEGRIFRIGDVKIEGNSIFSEQQIAGIIGAKKGEIANGKRLRSALYEDLKKIYGSQGFVDYDAEFDPEFKDNPNKPEEGIVDIIVRIDEGKQYRLRRLEFTGNTFTRDTVLRREFLINEGDVYNQNRVEISVARLNQTQYFDPIDKDRDLEIRTNQERGEVDTVVKVAERGRQQISFNGGVSGIGGSFFGLTYSTNNLLGRGESLSFNFAAGNRQQSFQFSFQEPYFQDRPISVGFSLFTSRYKYFGRGTFLSQNIDAITAALNPTFEADEANLFTQSTYGGTFFATAPLSEFLFKKRRFTQFSRVGLTYQFSATTIKDPEVNQTGDSTQIIPIIYAQPNIITSRITPTFVYDTRQPSGNGIDMARGSQLSASIAFSGLGGDVRTYQPNISYSKFIPIRKRRSKNPEVFAFRVQASTIGSFATSDKVRNANSLSFIGGVPAFERQFLGSEFDIRGYTSRSIGPVAPYETYLTSENITLATNATGTPETPVNLSVADLAQITQLGTYTGEGGANPVLFNRTFQFIGGDTRLLGNFEYRFPIFGPLTLAAFADVGTVFNLQKTGVQNIDTNFLRDDLLIGNTSLTLASLLNDTVYERSFGTFIMDDATGNVVTRADYEANFCGGNRDNCPTTLPAGLTPLFLRGDVQTNGRLRVDEAVFDSISNWRASVGLEMRVQIPVVNVPFRLIYFYNPNIKLGFTDELPGVFLRGKRSGLRFTVGRTF